MKDQTEKRLGMVRQHIAARGIRDARVLEAMRRVPRHEFVLESNLDEAYADYPLPIGFGQTISQPYIVALMTELLDVRPESKVLEIGSGSGYQAAVLAELAERVVSLERIPELADRACRTLARLGYHNVEVHVADGTLGRPEEAPYARIMVTAASPKAPGALLEQLAEGGGMVIPVGPMHVQDLQVIRKEGGKTTTEYKCGCRFVKLIGEQGWSPE